MGLTINPSFLVIPQLCNQETQKHLSHLPDPPWPNPQLAGLGPHTDFKLAAAVRKALALCWGVPGMGSITQTYHND
jgi:hypothetical protein